MFPGKSSVFRELVPPFERQSSHAHAFCQGNTSLPGRARPRALRTGNLGGCSLLASASNRDRAGSTPCRFPHPPPGTHPIPNPHPGVRLARTYRRARVPRADWRVVGFRVRAACFAPRGVPPSLPPSCSRTAGVNPSVTTRPVSMIGRRTEFGFSERNRAISASPSPSTSARAVGFTRSRMPPTRPARSSNSATDSGSLSKFRSANSTFLCARNSRAARHPVQVGLRYSVIVMVTSAAGAI